MKKTAIAILSTCCAFSAQAAISDFTKADMDKDGALSTEEARFALPELRIQDDNADGMISKLEIERALPGLEFKGDQEMKAQSLVGKAEYEIVVSALTEAKN